MLQTSPTFPIAMRRMVDADRRRALRRLGMTALMYAVSAGFIGWSFALGLMPAWAAVMQVAVWAAVLVGFFLMLHTGIVWIEQDPSLAYTQLLFGIASIALCYAVNPSWRGYSLQVLFVVLVFDMQRLSRRQITWAGGLAVGAMVAAQGLAWWLGQPRDELTSSLFFIAMAAVHAPLLSFLASKVRGTRLRHEQSKRDLDKALADLNELSARDALTGAFNRRHGMSCIELELRRQHRIGKPLALALIDLDHFKQVNDNHGHDAGDAVLKAFADLARAACTPDDVFIRWGGEEFVLLLGSLHDRREAWQRVEALRLQVSRHDWGALLGERRVTMSAGVVVAEAGCDAVSLLSQADQVLYEAKHAGRNRVHSAEQAGG